MKNVDTERSPWQHRTLRVNGHTMRQRTSFCDDIPVTLEDAIRNCSTYARIAAAEMLSAGKISRYETSEAGSLTGYGKRGPEDGIERPVLYICYGAETISAGTCKGMARGYVSVYTPAIRKVR